MNLTSETRQTRWRNQHPSRYQAHLTVQQALKSGSLVKQPCEVCGRTDEETRIDAHHDDYDEPLEVRWLCRLHHVRHHAGGTDLFTRTESKNGQKTGQIRPVFGLPSASLGAPQSWKSTS